MKAARFLTPLLAGATVILLVANALPAVHRRHRLERRKQELIRDLARAQERSAELGVKVRAAAGDRFYIQRLLAETWHGVPQGAIVWEPGRDNDCD